jgi:hypothetical protein
MALARQFRLVRSIVGLSLLLAGCAQEHAFWTDGDRGKEVFAEQRDCASPATSEPVPGGEVRPVDATPDPAAEPVVQPNHPCPLCQRDDCRAIWGTVGLNAFPWGDMVASNGVEFHQLFCLDLDFNIMLWREHNLYGFSDAAFWGQKAAPGITNPRQGAFDFSKREFDLSAGLAWNYFRSWELRVFAYSFNNLNRGDSEVSPSGFNDGVGVENRFYLGPTYEYLGTAAYDPRRASFLSIGYFPTKSMMDPAGEQFRPGPFLRAYLTYDLFGPRCYVYGDFQFIASRNFQAELLNIDVGVAVRPFEKVPRLEFRLGSQDSLDLQRGDGEYSTYLGIHYVF